MPRYQDRIGGRGRDDEYRFGWRDDERIRRSPRDYGDRYDRYDDRYDDRPRYGAMDRSYDDEGRLRQRRDEPMEDPYEYDDRGMMRYDRDEDRYEPMEPDEDFDRDHFNIEEDDRAGRVWRSSGGRGAMDQGRLHERSREYNLYGRDPYLRDRYIDDRERYLRERYLREQPYGRREGMPTWRRSSRMPGREPWREMRGYDRGYGMEDDPRDRRDYDERRERGPYRPRPGRSRGYR